MNLINGLGERSYSIRGMCTPPNSPFKVIVYNVSIILETRLK